jgi:hypothetical protein
VVLSLALIVRGDVSARATASTAHTQAEAQAVVAILANYQFAQPASPGPAPYLVQKKDDTYLRVTDINFADDQFFLTTAEGIVPSDQMKALISGLKIKTDV